MSTETESESVEVVDQSEAEALASAMAGYNARGGNASPPADVSTDEAAQPDSNTPAIVQDDSQPQEVQQQAEPDGGVKASNLAEQLAALKEEVKARSSEYSPEDIRKMNGDIGDINRRLKALEPPPQPATAPAAPENEELAAAMKQAEQLAEDFPELAGPLVAALKASVKAQPQVSQPAAQAIGVEEISAIANKAAQNARIAAAQEALEEEHPDWTTVRNTPQFKEWFSSRPADYQEKLTNTWNPAVVARGLTEYKESVRTKQQKQNRLSSAITPRGVPTPPAPSKLSDDEGFARGYAKGAPRPLHKR